MIWTLDSHSGAWISNRALGLVIWVLAQTDESFGTAVTFSGKTQIEGDHDDVAIVPGACFFGGQTRKFPRPGKKSDNKVRRMRKIGYGNRFGVGNGQTGVRYIKDGATSPHGSCRRDRRLAPMVTPKDPDKPVLGI